ncbi:MAG: hypothetical protein WEC84_05035 [Candidatus Andersenbacteria bacterium]
MITGKYIFWILLSTAGVLAAARWFHPATFSLRTLLLVVVAAFVVGFFYVNRTSQ